MRCHENPTCTPTAAREGAPKKYITIVFFLLPGCLFSFFWLFWVFELSRSGKWACKNFTAPRDRSRDHCKCSRRAARPALSGPSTNTGCRSHCSFRAATTASDCPSRAALGTGGHERDFRNLFIITKKRTNCRERTTVCQSPSPLAVHHRRAPTAAPTESLPTAHATPARETLTCRHVPRGSASAHGPVRSGSGSSKPSLAS